MKRWRTRTRLFADTIWPGVDYRVDLICPIIVEEVSFGFVNGRIWLSMEIYVEISSWWLKDRWILNGINLDGLGLTRK